MSSLSIAHGGVLLDTGFISGGALRVPAAVDRTPLRVVSTDTDHHVVRRLLLTARAPAGNTRTVGVGFQVYSGIDVAAFPFAIIAPSTPSAGAVLWSPTEIIVPSDAELYAAADGATGTYCQLWAYIERWRMTHPVRSRSGS